MAKVTAETILNIARAEVGTSASGEIFVYASSTLNLRAGTYTVFCGW